MAQNWKSQFSAEIRSMAAIRIVLWFLYNSSPHRIEMDVPNQFFPVSICVIQNGFVPPPKNLARALLRQFIHRV